MGVSLSRGRQLWLGAGQELLRRGGVAAVKLHALTEELLLTTGSFYHHFASMRDFLDQLADHYSSDQTTLRLALADDPDPVTRLRRLCALAKDDRSGPLDAAMRDWAGSNVRAAQAVEDADRHVLRFLERAFSDLGHARRAAQLRAHLIYAMGVARITPPWQQDAGTVEHTIELLAAPGAGHAVQRRPRASSSS